MNHELAIWRLSIAKLRNRSDEHYISFFALCVIGLVFILIVSGTFWLIGRYVSQYSLDGSYLLRLASYTTFILAIVLGLLGASANRPAILRALPKEVWLWHRVLLPAVVTWAVWSTTVTAYYFGFLTDTNLSVQSTLTLILLSTLLVGNIIIWGWLSATIIRILTKSALLRTLLVLLVAFGAIRLLASPAATLTQTSHFYLSSAEGQSRVLLLIFLTSTLAVAISLLELCFSLEKVSLRTSRNYMTLLTGKSSFTSCFTVWQSATKAELLRFARDSHIQRRIIVLFLTFVGSISVLETIRQLGNQESIGRLMIWVMGAIISSLGYFFSYNSARYQFNTLLPAAQTRQARFLTSSAVMVILSVGFSKLLLDSMDQMTFGNLLLFALLAITVHLIWSEVGWYSKAEQQGSRVDSHWTIVGFTACLLLASIVALFYTVVSVWLTIVMVTLWALAWYSIGQLILKKQ